MNQVLHKKLLAWCIIAGLLDTAATAQQSNLTMTVVTKKASITVSDAVILVNSHKGYSLGRAFQDFGGIYVTDAVVPPEGVELKRKHLPWKTINKIEIIDWFFKANSNSCAKIRVTTADSSIETFVWNPANHGEFIALQPEDLKIIGKLSIDGKNHEVEIKGSEIARIEITSDR